MTRSQRLRQLIDDKPGLVVPGAYDAVSAKLVERAGFPVVYLLFNYAPSGRSPLLPFARLRELGYAVILLPVDTLFVAARAVQDLLRHLGEHDGTPPPDRYVPFAEFNEMIGVTEQFELARRYAS